MARKTGFQSFGKEIVELGTSAKTWPMLGVLGVMLSSAFFWNSTKSKW